MAKYLLKLYVSGKRTSSENAISNLRDMCENELSKDFSLQIIDVVESPQLAEDDKVLATPTLVKSSPPPIRRIVGDLSNKEEVLLGLDLGIEEQKKKFSVKIK